MSFNPLAITTVAYIGSPFTQPTKLCSPLIEAPAMVPLSFAWALYGVSQTTPDVSIPIDINVGNSSQLIRSIRGVYIDNTQSGGSVYVYFPDSQMMVACGPFATAFQPVMTGGLQCIVIGKGFKTDDTSQTKVFLLNTPIAPGGIVETLLNYPQWVASPSKSENGFNQPALGDQFQSINTQGQNGTVDVALFGTPYTNGGTIILTNYTLNFSSDDTGASTVKCESKVLSTGAQGTLYDDFFVDQPGQHEQMANLQGMQIRLDAADSWLFRTIGNGSLKGHINAFFSYCYQGPDISVIGSFGTSNNASSGTTLIQGANPKAGIQFTAPLTAQITSAEFFLGNGGSGSVSIAAKIYTNVAGSPGALLGTSNAVTVNGHDNSAMFNFPSLVSITLNTVYWLVLDNLVNYGGADIPLQTCGNIAGYGSGRAGTVAGLTVNLAVDYRVNISYRT